MHSPRVESLFLLALWSSLTQAPLPFKAKCSGASSSGFLILRLFWRATLMWEHLCVVSVCLILFGARATFSSPLSSVHVGFYHLDRRCD